MAINSVTLEISGMHCAGCGAIVEHAILEVPGVISADSNFNRRLIRISFDTDHIDRSSIELALEKKGYPLLKKEPSKHGHLPEITTFLALLVVVGGIALWGKSLMPDIVPQLSAQMSHFLLFSIGILTGFHCIGMCGSFVVSYAKPRQPLLQAATSHLLYGAGKTLSYSALGAAFGLLGATITITVSMRFAVALLSGVFLVLYGIKMLNLLPSFNFLQLRLPTRLSNTISKAMKRSNGPFTIGILNGLMLGCGPLQAMYILAAGTADPLEGAALLFSFGVGTLLPLLSFGMFASSIPPNAMNQLVRASGALVMLMGGMMLNRGLLLLT